MSQPPDYTPATDFSQDEANNAGGRSTVRTANLDAEFAAVAATIDAINVNLSLNQRDDGEIRDQRVKTHTLSAEVLAMLAAYGATPRGAWLTATDYVLKDLVSQSGNTYMAASAHASGVFATDLAAGRWLLFTLGTAIGASAVAFAPTATLASTNAQAAIEESDTENRVLSAAALAAAVAAQATATAAAPSANLASTASASVGTGLLGWLRAATSAVATTLYDWLDWQSISVFEFMTGAEKVDVKARTYTLDVSAAIAAADAAVLAKGGGTVKFRAGGFRVNSALTRSTGVAWKGAGLLATDIRAYHNGNIVNGGNGTLANDGAAGIEDMTLRNGPSNTSAIGIYNYGLTLTSLKRVKIQNATIGLQEQFVLNSGYEDVVSECATGHYIVDTSNADPVNNNTYTRFKCTSGNTVAGTLINAGHSYNLHWINCGWENATGYPVRVTNGANLMFTQPYFEGNSNSVRLDGGECITFDKPTNISNQVFIDSNFGAKDVRVIDLIDNVNAGVLQNAEIQSSVKILELAGFQGRDVLMVGQGYSDAISHMAYQPNHMATGASSGRSFITPFGGPISPVLNYVSNQDMSNAGTWTGSQSTGGATNPYGGANAFTLPSSETTHQTSSLGSAATGRTFTAQVWVFCSGAGVVRLQAGTTTAFYKDTTFRLANGGVWVLLSATFTAPTDASTSGLMTITKSSGTVLAWRPCFYESGTPQPSTTAGRDLTGITLPMEMKNHVLFCVSTAVPSAGSFLVGDQTTNTVGTVGQPKGWTCTVAGSPGTQTSHGNL